jgi:hypothetical protein
MSDLDKNTNKMGLSPFRIFSLFANFVASIAAGMIAGAAIYVYQNYEDIIALPRRIGVIEATLTNLKPIEIKDLDEKVTEIKTMHLSLLNGFQEVHVGVLTSDLAEKALLSPDQVIVVNRDHNPLHHSGDINNQAYNGDTILIKSNKDHINQFTQLYVKEVSDNPVDKKKNVDLFIHETTAKLIAVLPLKGGDKHHVKLLKADEMQKIVKANSF